MHRSLHRNWSARSPARDSTSLQFTPCSSARNSVQRVRLRAVQARPPWPTVLTVTIHRGWCCAVWFKHGLRPAPAASSQQPAASSQQQRGPSMNRRPPDAHGRLCLAERTGKQRSDDHTSHSTHSRANAQAVQHAVRPCAVCCCSSLAACCLLLVGCCNSEAPHPCRRRCRPWAAWSRRPARFRAFRQASAHRPSLMQRGFVP